MTQRVPRRQFLRQAAVGAGLLASPRWLHSAETAGAPGGSRPNLLFIFTDQQRADMMSCAGNRWLKTPAMDSIAANGARFELAYAVNPVCAPARFGLMTGAMPSRIGMEENSDIKNKVAEDILAHSLGRIFREAGYETAYGGKVHLPMKTDQIGFDYITKDERDQLAEACAAFLRRKRDRPFLLVASFINPHDICGMASSAYKQSQSAKKASATSPSRLAAGLKLPEGMSRHEFVDKNCPPLPANFEIPEGEPDGVKQADPRAFRFWVREHWTEDDWRLHRWRYGRLTEQVDGEIGVVLRALREAGLEENTLIVFSSDHGDMDASHRLEHKSVLYEEAMRVPFLVSWKGVTKPGLVDGEHLVSAGLDLIPTLCDFAGVACPKQLAGRGVRALAEGRAPDQWRKTLVIESNHCRAIRTARFKYTVYDVGEDREALVDLQNDPGEMKNLARDPAHRETLLECRKLLQDWYRENGETLVPGYIAG
ncbi:MAG: sulfatase-like hydrolase/transferase [Candidatus Sumerlaeota bacterium]|nr:sulfatase-like hydrolase/transferase [Candidatus Sumerlaeota bacterium]